ncbi:MAG: bifunctional hydroxymethylpyrimidine kinase/phosphomethylpyrimidine kinase [Rhodospirillaceae bacterium]|jgi:hydroxymethylpyrimidine/phosphomethylpyrimidine kinase|nr:bifunctional hydroxymethylpyrimidine kinase/phosphomethylpyrimidine kinase [Rhodospirillaceae bacterium]
MKGRVLIIAGSDSGGGAGIQADIKTVTALGGFAMTAVTALTAQNTLGVHAIHDVPPDFIAQQMRVVLEDIGADAIKIGMLGNAAAIEAVADALSAYAPEIPIILDPVMVAKGGAALLEDDASGALISRLLPMATLLTPNIPEAEVLAARSIADIDDMEAAGRALIDAGAKAVLMKGGHMEGDVLTDLLIEGGRIEIYSSPRQETAHTHGTGCTLASACAVGVAQGLELPQAVARARDYVQEAIRTAPGYGSGHGPLNHGHTISD